MKKHLFLVLLLSISIFCYLSVLIPPKTFWPGVFTSYAIPPILGLNLLLLLSCLLFRRNGMIYPLFGVLAGIPFLLITVSVHRSKESGKPDLSVLSFNSRFFRNRNTYSEFSLEMIKWATNDSSDIKCFQEYSTNSRWPVLDVTHQIEEKGYTCFAFAAEIAGADHNPGLAIFSKYPMIDSGFVWKDHGSKNAGLFADIDFSGDTIRIYNVHLASMGLQLDQYKEPSNYISKIRDLVTRLKNGAEARSIQTDKLIEHVEHCPHPFIICGDFNETPYSYNYFRIRRLYANTFEESGSGFGFTFNSALFFLRIDHQFYQERFSPIYYKVDRSMKISDHFPTRAHYQFN
jgi:endonuclease/exonuclease/phosphatase family metal-dependent hydrolase